jgi:hypothetical protein
MLPLGHCGRGLRFCFRSCCYGILHNSAFYVYRSIRILVVGRFSVLDEVEISAHTGLGFWLAQVGGVTVDISRMSLFGNLIAASGWVAAQLRTWMATSILCVVLYVLAAANVLGMLSMTLA